VGVGQTNRKSQQPPLMALRKLNEYSADGVPVPPPGGGEPHVAA
jgi:hypothetical protein